MHDECILLHSRDVNTGWTFGDAFTIVRRGISEGLPGGYGWLRVVTG
jgi:hypothetical protein